MSVATRSYLALVEAVVNNVGALEQGTLTASAAGTLTSATYPFKTQRTNASTKTYEGQEIYITSGTAVLNPQQIAAYVASTGAFTPGINYTSVPSSTATFDILMDGIRLLWVQNAVNVALRRMRFWSLYPLTLVTDGNMESSATSSYTATNTSMTKVTNANVPRGARALRCANSSASGQTQSATITAAPVASTDGDYGGGGRDYYLHAWCKADVSIGTLIAYDVTNSAEIDSQTWDNRGWGVIDFTFTLPATCEAFAIILRGTSASADIYWTNIVCHRIGSHEMTLPDWTIHPEHVRNVYSSWYNLGLPDELTLSEVLATPKADMGNANNLLRLNFTSPMQSRPYWFLGSRPFDALSADSDTTTADREWVEAAATMELCKYMKLKYPKDEEWQARFNFWLKEATRFGKLRQHAMGTKVTHGKMDSFVWSSVT